MPKDVETVFPNGGLLGALIALGNLASRSELVVMQSAGFSRFQNWISCHENGTSTGAFLP